LGIGPTGYTPSVNGATQFRAANAADRLLVVGNAIDLNNNDILDASERSNAFLILKNGNTAIGNIDPTTKLDVDGQVRIRGGTPAAGRVLMGDATGLATWVDPTTIPTNAWGLTGNAATDPSTNYIGTSNDQSLVIRTNNVERMRVQNTGNVAIGNANPNTRLDVVAGTTGAITRVMTVRSSFIANNTGTGIALINSSSNTSNVGSEIISVTTNASTGLSDLRFHVHGGGTFGALDERMRILGNGNVGIGTNTPTRRLHVATGVSGATSNANTALLVEGEAATYQHFLTPSTAESGLLYGTEVGSIRGGIFFNNTNATDGMQFRTGGNATRMTLTSAGNLGIGTNTPARRLHVATGASGATSIANAAVVVEGGGATYQHYLVPSSAESGLLFGTEVGSVRSGIIFNNSNVSEGLQFRTGGNNTRMSITDAGLVGIGTTAPATRLQVNGGIAVTPPAVVSATTLPFVYNAGDRSYIRMGSNGTPANRIVVLENGLSVGQILVVECTATGSNGIRFQNAGNMSVSGLRDLLVEDTITFIWNGTKWLEISYSNN
jgi:trimeric autotransporter adhesin